MSDPIPMKPLSRLIVIPVLLLFSLGSTAQTDIRRDTYVDPLLKQVAAGSPALIMFGRQEGNGRYVNIAVLNKTSRQMKWFTCHGIAFDSAQLNGDVYEQVLTKKTDPFALYRQYRLQDVYYIESAELSYRLRDNAAVPDTSLNSRLVLEAPAVKSAKSTLQKMLAMEGMLKRACLQLRLFDSRSPRQLATKQESSTLPDLQGKMISRPDSTEYYNSWSLAAAGRIVLHRQAPGKMYVYGREGALLDSVPLKAGKYASLLKEKEDVFLLYRGWLELQWQQVTDRCAQLAGRLSRRHTGSYSPVSQAEQRQLHQAAVNLLLEEEGINNKIKDLIVPEEKYVEQLVAQTYKDAAAELSYLPGLGFAYSTIYTRGQKEYELTDHRGNAMAIVSDKKKSIDEDQDGVIEYYHADVAAANDYYAFGMLQPGRSYNAGGYRFGFNGKENDNEIKGDGNQLDYGMRIYDPRIGKFLSTDPLTTVYPGLTPYQFASNRPIDGIDLDGKEWTKTETYDPRTGITRVHYQVKLKIVNESKVFKDVATLKAEAVKQFAAAFKDVGDGKTVYSGTLEVTTGKHVEGDFSSTLADYPNSDGGGLSTAPNTKRNNSSINAYNTVKGAAPNTPRSAKEVAQDVVHELIHTAGPDHPDDANQAADIQLIRDDKIGPDGKLIVNYKLGPKADLEKVVHNIMIYSRTRVNGKQVKEYVPNKLDRNKVSPGQSAEISNQIDKDEKKKP